MAQTPYTLGFVSQPCYFVKIVHHKNCASSLLAMYVYIHMTVVDTASVGSVNLDFVNIFKELVTYVPNDVICLPCTKSQLVVNCNSYTHGCVCVQGGSTLWTHCSTTPQGRHTRHTHALVSSHCSLKMYFLTCHLKRRHEPRRRVGTTGRVSLTLPSQVCYSMQHDTLQDVHKTSTIKTTVSGLNR